LAPACTAVTMAAMFERLIESTTTFREDPDTSWTPIFESTFEMLLALRIAREAVDYLAAEKVGNDRPMADTRLKAIVEVAKAILTKAKK
jgi:hypothetical protein